MKTIVRYTPFVADANCTRGVCEGGVSWEVRAARERKLWDLPVGVAEASLTRWELAMASAKKNGLRSPEEYFKFALRRAITNDEFLGQFADHEIRTDYGHRSEIIIVSEAPALMPNEYGLGFWIHSGLEDAFMQEMALELPRVLLPVVCGKRRWKFPGGGDVTTYAEPIEMDASDAGRPVYRVLVHVWCDDVCLEEGYALHRSNANLAMIDMLTYGRSCALGILPFFDEDQSKT